MSAHWLPLIPLVSFCMPLAGLAYHSDQKVLSPFATALSISKTWNAPAVFLPSVKGP